MLATFLKLSSEKRYNILRAACCAFAKNGYKKTSVDEIVAKAGISKGILFHYFGNKKSFYLFMFEYYTKLSAEQIQLDCAERDLFQKLKQAEHSKMRLMHENPFMFDFLKTAYFETDPEVVSGIKRILDLNKNHALPSFFENVDYSKLKSGLDANKVLNIIRWCSEGFIRETEQKENFDIHQAFSQFGEYLDLLKETFYKENEL